MKLPEQAIREFQAAWFTSFGEEITTVKAEMEGTQLLNTFNFLLNQHEYEQCGKSESV